MATNLAIDDELLDEALKVGGQRTKKATVTQALQEYIQHRRQTDVLKLFGKSRWIRGTIIRLRGVEREGNCGHMRMVVSAATQ